MATIISTLFETVSRRPDALALSDNGREWRYQDLKNDVLRTALAMQKRGLKEGDRFAIWAPNCAEWIIATLAGQALGAVMVTLNTRFKAGEATDILLRSKSKMLFTVNGFLDTDYVELVERDKLPDLTDVILLRDGADENAFARFMAEGERGDESLVAAKPEGICDIIYTSGTTGAPKGVMTTHQQNVAVFDAFTKAIGMNETDRYLVVNPFFHSFGYKAGWLSCLIRGAAIFPQAVFDPLEVMARIQAHGISVMPGAPTIFQVLLAHEARSQYDLSSLRVATTGATTIPVDLIRQMHEDLGIDHVYSAYGLTESSGVVTLCQQGDDFETIATTCGRPLPGTELRLVDEDGQDVAKGEEGELWVRGFNVMAGYLDDPEATAETITEDGWLKTGDIGTQDARGYVRITDRKKDMIIVGGFNCYPAEVEKMLLTHPAIADAAVIGQADERLGEVPQAFLVKSGDIDEAGLIAWVRETLANYKVPRKVTFVDELPRNASGKILKYQLKS